jgi:hypothetical protein
LTFIPFDDQTATYKIEDMNEFVKGQLTGKKIKTIE